LIALIRFRVAGLVLGALTLLLACTPAQPQVNGAWARPASEGETSAVYFEFQNAGLPISIVGASAAVSEGAMLHQTLQAADGVMQMEHITEIPVGANESVTFEPGGYHIMLMGLTRPLVPGDHFALALRLESNLTIEVDVVVHTP
jgi:copper(I)-binding protein